MPKAVGGLKVCSTCKVEQPVESFHRNRHRPDGRHSDCKACVRAANVRWRQANPEKLAVQKARYDARYARRSVLKQYGVSEADYEALLLAQRGVCAICKGVNENGKSLAVDHCHTTGRVRGLLCANCNLGLGNFRDATDFLAAAIDYLRETQDLV